MWPISFFFRLLFFCCWNKCHSERYTMGGISPSTSYKLNTREGGLFLIFPKLSPSNKANVSNLLTWSISHGDWGMFWYVALLRMKGKWTPDLRENTNSHHPLGVRRNLFLYCLSKQEHWTTRSQEKRPGTRLHCYSLFLFWRQCTLVCYIGNQLRMETMGNRVQSSLWGRLKRYKF